jgi:hypothetical protein
LEKVKIKRKKEDGSSKGKWGIKPVGGHGQYLVAQNCLQKRKENLKICYEKQ